MKTKKIEITINNKVVYSTNLSTDFEDAFIVARMHIGLTKAIPIEPPVKNFLAEEKTEYDLLKERWGNPIKYLDMDCPNCKRHRVELFANNKGVCEKCSHNVLTGEFESEHWEIHN